MASSHHWGQVCLTAGNKPKMTKSEYEYVQFHSTFTCCKWNATRSGKVEDRNKYCVFWGAFFAHSPHDLFLPFLFFLSTKSKWNFFALLNYTKEGLFPDNPPHAQHTVHISVGEWVSGWTYVHTFTYVGNSLLFYLRPLLTSFSAIQRGHWRCVCRLLRYENGRA